jgi:hypothetical protein
VISTPSKRVRVVRAFERLDDALRPILRVAAQMMGERAATTRTLERNEIEAAPGQHARGCTVDVRRQRLLHAARQQRDARAA